MFRQRLHRLRGVENIVERSARADLCEFGVQDRVRMRTVGDGIVDRDVAVEEVAKEQCRGPVAYRSQRK